MNVSTACFALGLVAAAAGSAAEPPAGNLTWQEANKRSAELLKSRSTVAAGADMAREAFDLYPPQTQSYNAANHAQLLLNLVNARDDASGRKPALDELERGMQLIVQRTGLKDPVLVDLWRQGAAVAGPGSREGERYFAKAMEVAEQAWGPEDPRTIKLSLNMVHDLRQEKGYSWAKAKFQASRARAAKAGEDSALVSEIDLILAKIDMEAGKRDAAIAGYKALIERLEKRTNGEQETTLGLAYGLLEYTYEESGNRIAAAEIRQRRSERSERPYAVESGVGAPGELVSTMRVPPQYPLRAAEKGQQGVVDLQVEVNPDGSVASVKVVRSEPAGVFDESAVKAVRKWKFKPKIVDGKAVASSGSQRIEYILDDDGRGSK